METLIKSANTVDNTIIDGEPTKKELKKRMKRIIVDFINTASANDYYKVFNDKSFLNESFFDEIKSVGIETLKNELITEGKNIDAKVLEKIALKMINKIAKSLIDDYDDDMDTGDDDKNFS